jgi:hypothetical protein
LQVLLDPTRAARLVQAGAPGFDAVTGALLDASWYAAMPGGIDGAIQRQTNMQVLYGLLALAFDADAAIEARALAFDAVAELDAWLAQQAPRDTSLRAQYAFARHEIERLRHDPAAIETLVPAMAPPGSPIGSD